MQPLGADEYPTCSAANPFGALDGSSGLSGTHRMGGLGFGLPMSRLYAQYFGEQRRCHVLVCMHHITLIHYA